LTIIEFPVIRVMIPQDVARLRRVDDEGVARSTEDA